MMGERFFTYRPWQSPTSPLNNDTDGDGQPDGWEMQIFSVQQNTNSHSLWISTTTWLPPNCDSILECGLGPGVGFGQISILDFQLPEIEMVME